MYFVRVTLLAAFLILAATSLLTAAGPLTVSYQGRLLSSSDTPVADGPYSASFSLWTASSGGSQVWTETQTIQCAKGLFSSELGSVTPLGELFTQYAEQQLWLEVQVTVSSIPQVMTPRTPLQSTPYSSGARRLVDDTASTGGLAIFAGVSIPQFIQLTNNSSSSRLGVMNGGVERAGFGVDVPGGKSSMRVGEYQGSSSTLSSEAELQANDTSSGLTLRQYEPGKTYTVGDATIYNNQLYSAFVATHDLDDDGVPDVITSMKSEQDRTGLYSHFQNGSIPTQSDFKDVIDSDLNLRSSTIDLDGDGHVDLGHWEKVDNTDGAVLSQSLVDVDDDGIPDVGVESSAKVPRSVLKQYFERGDKPTQSQIESITDENGASDDLSSTNSGNTFRVSSSTGSSSSKLHVSRDVQDPLGALSSVEEVSVQTSPDTASLSITSSSGGNHRDGWNLAHINDASVMECTMLNGLPPGEPVIGNARFFINKQSAMVGLGTVDPTARQIMVCTPDSVVHTSSMQNGSSSVINNMRTRINELESKLQALGLLARSSSTTQCTPDSALQLMECDDLSSGASTQLTSKTDKVSSATQGNFSSSSSTSSGSFGQVASESLIDSYIHREDDGISRSASLSATPNSVSLTMDSHQIQARSGVYVSLGVPQGLMELSDNGTPAASMTSNGDAYLSHSLGVGVASPSHPIEHSSGAHLTSGGVWTNASDANLKENFRSVNGEELLEKIDELPISQWNYKSESDDVTHIGPTAQDFMKTFGVGENDKTISTIDPSGIALAAIQQLHKENDQLKAQVAELKKMVEELARKR